MKKSIIGHIKQDMIIPTVPNMIKKIMSLVELLVLQECIIISIPQDVIINAWTIKRIVYATLNKAV